MWLADGLVAPEAGVNVRLARIDRLLDWGALAAVVAPIYAAPTGRPCVAFNLRRAEVLTR